MQHLIDLLIFLIFYGKGSSKRVLIKYRKKEHQTLTLLEKMKVEWPKERMSSGGEGT